MDVQRQISRFQTARSEGRITAEALQPLFSLNRQLLEFLASSSRRSGDSSPVIGTMRDSFRGMDEKSRTRLARAPLLIDAGFSQSDRWSRDPLRRSRSRRAAPNDHWLSQRRAVMIAESTFTLGWEWVHEFPSASRLLLGLSDACIAFFRQATLADVERLSERRHDWIRPRWEQDPAIWRSLISLACKPPRTIAGAVTLRAMSLVAADVYRQQRPSSAA